MFSKFSLEVLSVLTEQFPKTYFVGGAVRNILLNKKITDVDIATSALPAQVCALLKPHNFIITTKYENLGIIIADNGKEKIEIATFRKEVYASSRFPKVSFTGSIKQDSKRRDFTANAIYYQPITKELLDFHGGVTDLFNRNLRFIGKPLIRIKEDPLRIIRALKFSTVYNLNFLETDCEIIFDNLALLKKVSGKRLQKEISSVQDKKIKNFLQKVIHSNT